MPALDETFTRLPLDDLAEAALTRARDLGAEHADVRVVRIREARTAFRDARLESNTQQVDCGIAVRVVHRGVWGFAAGIDLSPEGARTLAAQAVATATVSAPLNRTPVRLAPEPVHQVEYCSDYAINPFDVAPAQKQARLADLSERLLAADGVHHADASVHAVQENTFYADLSGTRTVQQRVRIHPQITATSVEPSGFSTMRTLAPPAGRGWEYLTGTGWDFDAEIAELPELLAEHVKAPSVTAGPLDLVIDPTNLWLTIHESVAHATELDRALGYEAAYAGTSFATPDQLGTLRYGSPVMTVTGDRVTPHGLATVAVDDEGVAAQSFDIVRDGTLVGYQLNRQMAAQMQPDGGRSNGCAYADSPGHIPLQRMPNVSLQPGREPLSTADLIARVENGLYVVGDKSWSIDMQRYNFQFTAQRFYQITDGRITGQVRDAAYQATTTDFWRSLEAVGDASTYRLGGAMNCGKGQPGQVAPVSHGCPATLFRGVNVLNTRTEGGL